MNDKESEHLIYCGACHCGRVRDLENIVKLADKLCGKLGTKQRPAQSHYSNELGRLDCVLSNLTEEFGNL